VSSRFPFYDLNVDDVCSWSNGIPSGVSSGCSNWGQAPSVIPSCTNFPTSLGRIPSRVLCSFSPNFDCDRVGYASSLHLPSIYCWPPLSQCAATEELSNHSFTMPVPGAWGSWPGDPASLQPAPFTRAPPPPASYNQLYFPSVPRIAHPPVSSLTIFVAKKEALRPVLFTSFICTAI
jgi:hypothetical protein